MCLKNQLQGTDESDVDDYEFGSVAKKIASSEPNSNETEEKTDIPKNEVFISLHKIVWPYDETLVCCLNVLFILFCGDGSQTIDGAKTIPSNELNSNLATK